MSEGLVRNAADNRQVKQGRRAEKIRQAKQNEDLKWLLGERIGRRLYWKWLSKTGVFKQSMDERGNNRTNFNEGRRSVGLKMLADLTRIMPEAYTMMVKEAKEDELLYKSRNRNKENPSDE